jgi:membrane peptidoglycan carboxypeptidase
MNESSADRFRRLRRSLEETGDMEESEEVPSPSEEAASADQAPTPDQQELSSDEEDSARGNPDEKNTRPPAELTTADSIGEPPRVIPETESPPLDEAAGAASAAAETAAPKSPPKNVSTPQWRIRRRFSRTGPLPPAPDSAQSPAAPDGTQTRRGRKRKFRSCFTRMVLTAIFVFTAMIFMAAGFVLYEYFEIASTLPSVEDLKSRASQFETTRIYDRSGDLLYEILDPNEGRRTYTALANISPYMKAATIAIEDKNYYSHPGFDPSAIVRAFTENLSSGETVSGASTITQQLARILLLTPQERYDRSYLRKVREALLAVEITRRYSKDEILELYLNEISYGNLAYGVEAAAETYFQTTADKLTLDQASLLAGIPQAPTVYDVYSNREATLVRQRQVLIAMIETSTEQNCIFAGLTRSPVCVTAETAGAAWTAAQSQKFQPSAVGMRYPHWVNYIRLLLEAKYDPQTIYRSGFQVYTTLDPALQDLADTAVEQQVAALADKHVTGGALVAIRPATGEILAMVGSPDFSAEPSGQINMAIQPRQSGSAIKPLTYTAAFEKGWSPATLIWDVPTEFPPSNDPFDTNPPYKPVNYDGKFHGPVTIRAALANSYNIPAVKTLQFVGIYDDPSTPQPDGLIAIAKRFGITTLTQADYSYSLALGAGAVSPLELTSAYAVFANGGVRVPPVAITKIATYDGKTVFEYKPPAGQQIIRPEHAFLISSILSDNDARTPMFGPNSVLNLPFPVAVKTGTTNDFRDNWTLGYTPDLVTGVWVGNPDNTAMIESTGVSGAAPIWSQFMIQAVQAVTGGKPTPFTMPAGVIQKLICTVSGAEPSKYCPSTRTEYFASDQPPAPADQDLWRDAYVDLFTGLRSSASCPNFYDQKLTVAISDPAARQWLIANPDGQAWAKAHGFPDPIVFYPDGECTADSPHPILQLSAPTNGQVVTDSHLEIRGEAGATREFDHFTLEYALDSAPDKWIEVIPSSATPVVTQGKLADWDLSKIDNSWMTIRLTVYSHQGGKVELKVHFELRKPSPTPLPTHTPNPTATVTPTASNTPTQIPTQSPTQSPTQVPTGTDTDLPTATPTEAATATSTPVPSDTPTL